jgi:hypothetical protein
MCRSAVLSLGKLPLMSCMSLGELSLAPCMNE